MGDHLSISGTPAVEEVLGSGPSIKNGYTAINSGYGIYNPCAGNALIYCLQLISFKDITVRLEGF